MRTSNSIKNTLAAMLQNIVTIVIGFISQALFIKILNVDYLGLNELFSNVFYMLSIFELGIGSAIVFNLYKPIAENKIEKIKSLMRFYKKSYNIIALLILCVGLLLIPFLGKIVKLDTVTVPINIIVVYILSLLNVVSSYIITYKRNLIYANQKNYIINITHMVYLIFLNISQLFILTKTKNYYLYLILKIFWQLFENIVLNIICNKLYPYVTDSNVKKIDKEIERNIIKKVKALFFHKIGGIVVFGTDNIIISSFFDITIVGIYANYNLIIKSINNFINQIIGSVLASVGNLLILNDSDKSFTTFKRLRFLNFWLACFTGTGILIVMEPFIKVWVGEQLLLRHSILIVLVLNYYQNTMRRVFIAFKDASGTWEEDKFAPLIESFLNIVGSIVLLKIFGLVGVFMGTILSSLVLWFYSYPKFVYKKLFNKSYCSYFKEMFGYFLLFIVILLISSGIANSIIFKNVYLQVISNIIIAIIISNFIIIIIFRRTDNFLYFIGIFRKLLLRFTRKREYKIKKTEEQINTNNINENIILPVINEERMVNKIIIDKFIEYDELKALIIEDNNILSNFDYEVNYLHFDIAKLLMELIQDRHLNYEIDYFLRNNYYPRILCNSKEFMVYSLNKDFNNLAYVNIDFCNEEYLKKVINYACRRVYYLQKINDETHFDIKGIFKNSNIIENQYFLECLKYIK